MPERRNAVVFYCCHELIVIRLRMVQYDKQVHKDNPKSFQLSSLRIASSQRVTTIFPCVLPDSICKWASFI